MSILYEERLDGALPEVDRTSVLMALREHVPGLEILHTDEEIIPYECDGLSAYRTRPLLVVLPKQMEQVTAILAVCHRLRVPVVTRGAGTGLSGGALPLEKGVLLVMARFKEILDINPIGRRARVQPGVRNLAISQAVAPHNLYYAPDPSSQIACSIGGNVAENAGGVHCLKYGLTVHNLLKIEVQTLDGEALTLGSDALDSPGFDLLALFTGSEGMLGVTTEVTVKLLPKPPVARVLLASFDSVEKAGLAVGGIIANGIIPGGLEQVNQAISDKTPLVIQGSNSKAFLGRPVTGQTLDVRCHRGIVNYDPTELVITARAGTPLVAIEAALESAGQMLPCEPPHYGEEATWGGMVACGLAGPRRPWSGSVRDFVLGTRIITGTGKHLRFGGEVMKNVAGYDLSRLMAGSYGCLGVLTEISMKVLPRPRASLSLRREISLQEAMNEIAQWQLQPLPISGLCYFDNALWIRLEGGEGSVKAARELLGGEEVAGQFWQQLREQQLPFFSLPGTLWRISLPSDAPMMPLVFSRALRSSSRRPQMLAVL